MISLASHSPDPDTALIERFVTEQAESAFRELVDRHAGLVLAVARRQTGDEEAARDVAQRVFTLLARKARLLRRHPSITGWLFTACRLECRSHLRRETRRTRLLKDFAHHAAVAREDSGLPAELLDEALEQLPESDRELLLARYCEGWSFSDIAAARKVSEPAARKQVSRAVERLAGIVGARGGAAAAVTAGMLNPAMACAYPRGSELSSAGTQALSDAALHSAKFFPALALPVFMSAKATLVTGAVLVWIASLASGWQAGIHLSGDSAEKAAVSSAAVPPAQNAQVFTIPTRQQLPAGASKRTTALRDLIDRIAGDLEAAPWDSVAGIRARARLAALSDADAAEALAVAMELRDPPSALLAELWQRRGQSEGLTALKAVESLPSSRIRGARMNALKGWANTDPQAALLWIQSRTEPMPESLAGIFTSWAAKDPAAALTAAARLADPDQRVNALSMWCRSASGASQRPQLMETILSVPEASRAALLKEAAFQWKDDCPGYAAWLTGHQAWQKYGTAPLEALCGTWAGSDPLAAAGWLRGNMSANAAYPQLLERIVTPWAMMDAPGASEWLGAQPPGPEMDPSIVSLIGILPPNEGPAIVAWAGRMHNRSRAESILKSRHLESNTTPADSAFFK